jgi:hypothetical protein
MQVMDYKEIKKNYSLFALLRVSRYIYFCLEE